jgi:hypothetical protein
MSITKSNRVFPEMSKLWREAAKTRRNDQEHGNCLLVPRKKLIQGVGDRAEAQVFSFMLAQAWGQAEFRSWKRVWSSKAEGSCEQPGHGVKDKGSFRGDVDGSQVRVALRKKQGGQSV